MTPSGPFFRKVIYGVAIVALLFPLFLLGQPATRSATGGGSEGGKLAQLRSSYGLSQADLGEIDPASETMKMATLGLRGVATNLLWTQAVRYKRTENWDRFSATLNQIARLQPNFITVWEYQAHNLSYNISAEFDNYRDRYHWVKKGIEFLIEGTRYNLHSPRLYWNLGWFSGHKIGRADEYLQFRRLFRKDRDFQEEMVADINIERAKGPDGYPDNWLVGYLWYLKSQDVVDQGVPVTWLRIDPAQHGINDKRRSSVIFYSDAPMAFISYADAITEEIIPGEKTQNAWARAGKSWTDYGNMDIPTTEGPPIRLLQLEEVRKLVETMLAKLEALSPGLRKSLRDARVAKLSPEEREIHDKMLGFIKRHENPMGTVPQSEMTIARNITAKLRVSNMDVVDAMPEDLKVRARYYAARANEATALGNRISMYSQVVNYPYWKTRCDVEATKVTADARRFMLFGDRDADAGNPEGARTNYEKAWKEWAQILSQHPQLIDADMRDELGDAITRYRLVLEQLDEEFPDNFELNILLKTDDDSATEQPIVPAKEAEPAAAASAAAPESQEASAAQSPVKPKAKKSRTKPAKSSGS